MPPSRTKVYRTKNGTRRMEEGEGGRQGMGRLCGMRMVEEIRGRAYSRRLQAKGIGIRVKAKVGEHGVCYCGSGSYRSGRIQKCI